jgi:hypothetical protein
VDFFRVKLGVLIDNLSKVYSAVARKLLVIPRKQRILLTLLQKMKEKMKK